VLTTLSLITEPLLSPDIPTAASTAAISDPITSITNLLILFPFVCGLQKIN
jgi:hypothetical protein